MKHWTLYLKKKNIVAKDGQQMLRTYALEFAPNEANNGLACTLPNVFYERIKDAHTYSAKKNKVAAAAQMVAMSYKLFILHDLYTQRNNLFDVVFTQLVAPRAPTSIFAYNRAARALFLAHKKGLTQLFEDVVCAKKDAAYFLQLDAAGIADHWKMFAHTGQVLLARSSDAVCTTATKQYISRKVSDRPEDLFRGLVYSYAASFLRRKTDALVEKLFLAACPHEELHTKSYHRICSLKIDAVSKLFSSQAPELQLLANFAYDNRLGTYTDDRRLLQRANPKNAFSLQDLLRDDPFAYKRLCAAKPSAKMWQTQIAYVDLRRMGIRNFNGLRELTHLCNAKLEKIAHFPFCIRSITYLPSNVDTYTYAFAGINLAHNRISILSLPSSEDCLGITEPGFMVHDRLQQARSHLFYVNVMHNPITSVANNFLASTIIIHELPLLQEIAEHNARADKLQRAYFEKKGIGFNLSPLRKIEVRRNLMVTKGFANIVQNADKPSDELVVETAKNAIPDIVVQSPEESDTLSHCVTLVKEDMSGFSKQQAQFFEQGVRERSSSL